MHFTRLRLSGFKTFVEPTELLIEPGLTGVVGPNGCGKSNLVEALRWVMGESAFKAFRAQDMDAVIFAGTTGRPARDGAEVGVQLDNSARTAPASFNGEDVIEVTRRIMRGSGSSYRINGREARARDVHLLFADASTGARSPALVRQGQIGEIVNAKPAARRRILEEAAGITGLHARRHEADLRLKAAETNLIRLDDVLTHLSSQIEGLRRQSRQAARYRAVAADIRRQEARLLWLRWHAADAACTEARLHLERAMAESAARARDQAEAARLQAVAAHVLPGLRQAEAEAGAALQRLATEQAHIDQEEARLEARRQELDQRLVQITQDVVREQALCADAGAVLARLAQEAEELAAQHEEAVILEEDAHAAEAEANALLAQAEADLDQRTRALADLNARRAALEGQVREAEIRKSRASSELASLITQDEQTRQDGDAAALARAQEAAQAELARLAHAEDMTIEAEAELAAARAEAEAQRPALAEAEQRFGRLDAQARALKGLLNDPDRRYPPVADQLDVDKGYEMALGAALGDDLDLPEDERAAAHWAGAHGHADDPMLPEGAQPLIRSVRAGPALARRLNQIGVVTRADGPRLQPLLACGQRLVSPDGDLWRWDGLVARADAPTPAGRRLAERNRLAELTGEVAAAAAQAERLRAQAATGEAALKALAARETAARQIRRAAQQAADLARAAQASAERQAAQHTARLSALAEARRRITAAEAEATATEQAARTALIALVSPLELEAELTRARALTTSARTRLAEARAQWSAHTRERAARVRRLEAIRAEQRAWTDRADGADARMAALDTRQAQAAAERETLAHAPEELARARRRLQGETERARMAHQETANRLTQGESALASADQAARDTLAALAAAREEAARSDARSDAAQQRRDETTRAIAETLDGPPQAARALADFPADAAPPNLAEVEAALERARRERERLGAVNLRAEDELREADERLGTLTSERDDLIEAIARLRGGIQSLNREARARLQASFTVVDTHFRTLFDTLFGGGEAHLILTESEDPLDAGLDIIAKPPGKTPQSLSLLSGGEQALTAMALIFAVFLTNPAPICVLDEVDAPLDDANVERFCTLLDEMTRLTDTRFLVITHNPISMARMDRLYGVTMAERGVSRLVSVDLRHAEHLREVG